MSQAKAQPINDFHELSIELAKRERGLEQMTIAQIKELTGHFCDIYFEQAQSSQDQFENFRALIGNTGARRAKQKGGES